MKPVNKSIAWPDAVLCMRVLSQPCSQVPHPASHHWKVRLVLDGGGTSCPGRGHLVLGPHVRGNSWSRGTPGPPTPASIYQAFIDYYYYYYYHMEHSNKGVVEHYRNYLFYKLVSTINITRESRSCSSSNRSPSNRTTVF